MSYCASYGCKLELLLRISHIIGEYHSPGRVCFIHSAGRQVDRCLVGIVRVGSRLINDINEVVAEFVKGILVLSFSRLKHEALINNEREVNRRGMVATVEDALGKVQCFYVYIF